FPQKKYRYHVELFSRFPFAKGNPFGFFLPTGKTSNTEPEKSTLFWSVETWVLCIGRSQVPMLLPLIAFPIWTSIAWCARGSAKEFKACMAFSIAFLLFPVMDFFRCSFS